jgi:hypothetical protein
MLRDLLGEYAVFIPIAIALATTIAYWWFVRRITNIDEDPNDWRWRR